MPATQQVRFHTKSGLLTGDRAGEWIELDFPAKREEPAPAPDGLAEALGVMPKYVGKNQFDYLVEIAGAYQASPRGGGVRVRVVGDRVKLGGKAVTVLRGELLAG